MSQLLKVTVLLSFLLSLPAAAVVVGTVNMQKVLLQVNEGKKVRDQLRKEFEKKNKILKTEESSLKKKKAEIDKQAVVLNAAARAKKEKELQEGILKLQQKSLQFQREMQKKEDELKVPIIGKIEAVIKSVSKTQKVDITFDISTTRVVYTKDGKDLTDAVIKAYNKKHK
ncbi:MAG: OmpH family outer membrane protein [Bacteriovoracaceae bacterium]